MTTILDHEPQTADGVLTVATIEEILRICLGGLFEELSDSNWYVREHEIVNLFAFGHLVPEFQKRGLDLTMIGIECPVLQVCVDERSKFGTRKDLVIWSEGRTTMWKGCELKQGTKTRDLHALGRRPFAIVEWKSINRIRDRATARSVEKDYEADVAWLTRNLDRDMMTVGYAILVRQDEWPNVHLACRRVHGRPATDTDFLSLSR